MARQIKELLYRQEVQYLKKQKIASRILDQLKKKDHVLQKELHKNLNVNQDDSIPQKTFEKHLKKMIMYGLVQEIFTKDLKFKIILSSIGKDVHSIVRKTNGYLTATN